MIFSLRSNHSLWPPCWTLLLVPWSCLAPTDREAARKPSSIPSWASRGKTDLSSRRPKGTSIQLQTPQDYTHYNMLGSWPRQRWWWTLLWTSPEYLRRQLSGQKCLSCNGHRQNIRAALLSLWKYPWILVETSLCIDIVLQFSFIDLPELQLDLRDNRRVEVKVEDSDVLLEPFQGYFLVVCSVVCQHGDVLW